MTSKKERKEHKGYNIILRHRKNIIEIGEQVIIAHEAT
jgi:hypothetical protein